MSWSPSCCIFAFTNRLVIQTLVHLMSRTTFLCWVLCRSRQVPSGSAVSIVARLFRPVTFAPAHPELPWHHQAGPRPSACPLSFSCLCVCPAVCHARPLHYNQNQCSYRRPVQGYWACCLRPFHNVLTSPMNLTDHLGPSGILVPEYWRCPLALVRSYRFKGCVLP